MMATQRDHDVAAKGYLYSTEERVYPDRRHEAYRVALHAAPSQMAGYLMEAEGLAVASLSGLNKDWWAAICLALLSAPKRTTLSTRMRRMRVVPLA